VDPVTGLSRTQQIAIGLLIPLGIVGSTVATLVDERGDDTCPDQAYECATLELGEPIVIGVVDASRPSESWPVSDLGSQRFPPVHGHPILLDVREPGCSAKASAEDVRELASDPPDEPPAVLVIAAACDAAAIPMAQILSDSGITLLTVGEVTSVPTAPAYHLVAPALDLEAETAGLQPIGSVSHLRELLVQHGAGVLEDVLGAIENVAIRKEDQLLIPRTPLRDALISGGYPPAA
jgi:hypothetical protein